MIDSDEFWADVQFELFKFFAWIAPIGVAAIVTSFLIERDWSAGLTIFGALLVLPLAIHAELLSIWHWKSRYKGRHSMLWGALLIIETTGWSKVIYFFRHVLPDRRRSGRYAHMEGVC